MSLKILFAGTADFAVNHLQALIDRHYQIDAVLTQPDRPAGRGQKLKFNAVKILALEHHIPVYQPLTLKDEKIQQKIKALAPDLIIDIAYGLFLPKVIFDIPKWGCINVHPSLLPRWRGASPIQHAILMGDKETGITIMQVDEGWDTGPILMQSRCPIYETDTTKDLIERLLPLGIRDLESVIQQLSLGKIKRIPQDENQAIYAPKITKLDAQIDWKLSAITIHRQIRAFNPVPGAYSHIGGILIQVWEASPLNKYVNGKPGTISQLNKDSIDVITGEGVLRIQKIQFPGKKALSVLDTLNSKRNFFEQHKKFL